MLKMKPLIGLAILTLLGGTAGGAEPELRPEDLPRILPVEPEKAIDTFEVRPGFRIELVASEPLVVDPITMCFDENGRLFVVEMRDYPERRDERLGRIRLLEDTDGDGRMDKSTIFLQDLPWPTALFWYDGGLLVGATPDLIYAKDTTGDGVADETEVLFSGFGPGNEKLNVQALFNNLNWGLDNRIHGTSSLQGGMVRAMRHPDRPPVDVRGKGFVIDPRDWSITTEHGGGQYGLSFDQWGQLYTSSNSNHIQAFMYDARYEGRNPHFTMPQARVSIAADGPAAEVFRISPEEPWRVIRTRWRIGGIVQGAIEGGGRSAGYFTGATGITIYRGDAFGPGFVGNAFVGDAGGNLVHRKVIRREGVELIAERAADEKTIEFVRSSDNWFRSVDFANAPDGALYIADMYRETIEHPWSIPESIKKHLDLNSGNDRGRIWRVVPDDFTQRPLPRLGQASIEELVALLEHPNGWHRETAARLLFERQDRAAAAHVEKLLAGCAHALGRLHALYVLDGLDALHESHVLTAMTDEHDALRRHGVVLAETLPSISSVLTEQLAALANDPAPVVRYQLAFTLGAIDHPKRTQLLAEIARRDFASEWMRAAVASSLAEDAAEVFVELSRDAGQSQQVFLQQLARMIGARHDRTEVQAVLEAIAATPELPRALALALNLAEGAHLAGASDDLQPALSGMFEKARSAAVSTASTDARLSAVALLGFAGDDEARALLRRLLDARRQSRVQLAAMSALDRANDPQMAQAIVASWEALSPRVRDAALALLLRRESRIAQLLDAIAEERLPAAILDASQVTALHNHANAAIRRRAVELIPPIADRKTVIEQFRPALDLPGDASRGHAIYAERCVSCHRAAGEGYALGPDLESVRASGRDQLLMSILDPNREVQPNYVAFSIDTTDGENFVGIITSDTPSSLTITQAYGKQVTLLRERIRRMTSRGQSLMPEGLEADLTPQHLADLLEFITSGGK
jgi:putative membrane-bound dehydrogenase-like protein